MQLHNSRLQISIFTFIGVVLVSLGTPKTNVTDSSDDGKPKVVLVIRWYNYVLLAIMPIVIALGNLAMGEIRQLDSILIPFYINVGFILMGLVLCLVTGSGFYPSQED